MLSKLLEYLKDKRILILGFGIEGKSTYTFIRKYFPDKYISVCDRRANFEDELKDDKLVKCIYNDEYLKHINEYDIILKTPGISFKDIDISRFEQKITSQLELVLEYIDVFTIGVTGTKGKSTTSSLINYVLQKNNKNSILLGNIGIPIFESLDKLTKNTILVLELSSHALEYIRKSPNIAILLNIYEEHLDHYKSFDEYVNAKYNIFKYQKKTDYAIYNIDNEVISQKEFFTNAKRIQLSIKNDADFKLRLVGSEIYYQDSVVYRDDQKRHILGNHNLNNIMFVIMISLILNLDTQKTKQAIDEFMPLEHRMEYVGVFDGIKYYNDSIATIPQATINAINTLKYVNTLIVGGKDRGINLQGLIDYLNNSKIENIICLPKTGEYIARGIKCKNTYMVDDLEQAVKIAKEKTTKGTICLLSPAASSYGYFKNFEERGNLFKQYVSNNLN